MEISSSRPVGASNLAADHAQRRLAYRGARWAFAGLLGLSLVLLLASVLVALATSGRQPNVAEPASEPNLVLLISSATSIVSLIGLLSTNLLAWRREAREARAAELQLQRQQLEIEKLKLELEQQRNDAGNVQRAT